VEVTDCGVAGGEVIWGDYDNDGNLELFTSTGSGALYKNRGDGKFDTVAFPELPTKTQEVQSGSTSTRTVCLICMSER
jgi:hypothetical protein